VRVVIGIMTVAFAAAGSIAQASAQSYETAPVPPLGVGAGYEAPAVSRAPSPPSDTIALPAPAPERNSALRPPADVGSGSASADYTGSIRDPAADARAPDSATVIAALPPEEQPESGPATQLPPQFRRQLVDYVTNEPAGTIIIDTPHTYLYLVRGDGKALRYGVGVGREGFTWSGSERIVHMSQWPDWHPPKEMIERQPYLPRFMAGGAGNPLGARALYLGNTIYRIHGTNQPSTIGHFVSSGCIRLTNEDVEDLYSRVNLGTRVVVLPGSLPNSAAAQTPIAR
jgi:lipoprotein-anchoring transpeptidase ErfK/SrfK